ncbi:MAG TPA: CHY zinc finger protein [Planococcus sp. (in: firmicutes)]|nr:CHY zinc finger protein [Planococcus sp. (in: firmicutes)]
MPNTENVLGLKVDEETRCAHWHSEIDRIAIKFYCCGLYYACFECHEEVGCGKAEVWPKEQFDEKAVLCGSCGYQLAIREYLDCASVCPSCSSRFNPGCSLHKHLYFE